jgi:hypothetical protein
VRSGILLEGKSIVDLNATTVTVDGGLSQSNAGL